MTSVDDTESVAESEDTVDEWEERIIKTGCAEENERLQICHYDKQDWRQCLPEMEAFRKCWAIHGNRERVHTVDNDEKDRTL
ncbi:hypothetical protein CANINC_004455 [Pichia inconspicua]|uniref:CHCH domain-containing protein n=1 Tax=Pichia inconspicua TaxID=52247 RepID=A0A4T0WVK5_9ASCO|nr:hypothetical protein CANINC_004455 [[Candida] inconspicua]